jgi:hypothetical protein
MSFHCLTLGSCGTGKTYFNQRLAAGFQKAGMGVLALIPQGFPPWPEADRTLYDPAVFLDTAHKARRCALFIEMSDANISRYDNEFIHLATFSRHLGHRCFFIAQRHTQISATIRDQCGTLFIFRVGAKTAAILAEEFVDPALNDAPTLQGHSYIVKQHGKPATRVNIP